MWLEVQWDGDFDRKYAVTATDEAGNIKGAAALGYHSMWYAKCAENKVTIEYCTEADEANAEVIPALVSGLSEKLKALAADYPDKNVKLSVFVMEQMRSETQLFLSSGFHFGAIIPILSYDLEKPFAAVIPEDVTIEKLPKTDEASKEYLAATGIAHNGVSDSANQYAFRQSDESFCSFRAVSDGKTVGGISVWNMGEDGGTTEDIFTVPAFRRKGIASALISAAFDELRQRGKKTATLSMDGGNVNAMRLYQKIGYKLFGYMFELKFHG